jgi:hypothetical protein
MNLLRRHIGRRVAGVGVGVALLVLGLEAPAFAAAPVISSFTPDSGAAAGGCVLVVTGTGLDDFAVATWEFDPTTTGTNVPAADYVLVSDTEAWVVAPALTAGTAFNLTVTNAGGTSTSTGTFLSTAGAGNCAPTITSITPNCGSTNDKVVIAGTNLLLDATGTNTIVGGTVQFTPFTSNAAVVPPDSDTAIQLTRFVSADAADGPVKVIAGGGTAFSTESFAVPPQDCPPPGGEGHARSISLSLRKHLVARGRVSSTEDPAFTDCVASVPVKIQRRRAGGWRTVGSTTTTDTGAYKKRIKDRPGRYRALAPKVTVNDEVCLRAVSPRRTHRH